MATATRKTEKFMGGQPGYDEAGNKIFMGGQPGYDEAGTKIQSSSSAGNSDNVARKTEFMGGRPGYSEAGAKINPDGTPGDYNNPSQSEIPTYLYGGEKNVLHKFRNHTYLFTLAAVKGTALTNPESIRTSADYFVIAKSSGKVINQIIAQPDEKADTLISDFNKYSPGRFDMFINNVEIETVMGFNNVSNLSMATKINFEIFEPYSINGFYEALQVSAVAAGHYSYVGAPFLLKMEFMGYPDDETGPSEKPEYLKEEGTRYFIINIVKSEAEFSENGTKYRCTGVAHNEMGYADSNALKTPIQLEGSNVGTILNHLMSSLTLSEKEAAKRDQVESGEELMYDHYEIVFPVKENGKLNFGKINEKVFNAKLTEIVSAPNLFTFPSPGPALANLYNNAGQQQYKFTTDASGVNVKSPSPVTYDITKTSVQFARGSKIHDIIAAVIRDSSFGKDIFKKKPPDVINNGMIEYVHIGVQLEFVDGKWNPRTMRPICRYVFTVIPYNMHFTRVPLFQKMISQDEMNKFSNYYVKRKYDYLYTGKNIDIRRFTLNMNNLFYQAYPQGMGNFKIFSDPNGRKGNTNTVNAALNPTNPEDTTNAYVPQSPRRADPSQGKINKYGGNAGRRDYQSYDELVGNMHQAILDNTGMIKCEIEILGDPYYLVTGGIGNYQPGVVDGSITENGEAPYQTNDVVIVVEWRNPEDIDHTTGLMKFSDKRIPFSGCFRVIKVKSKFSDGLFTQVLNLVRIPGQPLDTLKQPAAGSASTKIGLIPVDAPVDTTATG